MNNNLAKKIKLFLTRRKSFLLVFWIFLILFLCLVSFKESINIKPVSHTDKIVHFIFYFVLTLLLYFNLRKLITKECFLCLTCFLISGIFGCFIEFLQETLTKNRFFETKDIIANIFGTIIAIALIKLNLFKNIE